MKDLQDYRDEHQSKLFDETFTFFAFNGEQVNKGIKEQRAKGYEGKFTRMGGGMFCASNKVQELVDGLERIDKEGIEFVKSQNTPEQIIISELYNYECFYTGDLSSAIAALEGFGFTPELIRQCYVKEYPNYEKHNC